jgi:hypothetical protein
MRSVVDSHITFQMTQARVLIFVAAPAIVRWLYRLRRPRGGPLTSDEELGIPAAADEGVIECWTSSPA